MSNIDEKLIVNYIERSISVKKNIIETQVDLIYEIVIEIVRILKSGYKIFWFGNGGSAADAQHLACELVSKFYLQRNGLPSIALTTNSSELTAIANDFGFEHIFEKQLEALGKRGDIAIAISVGGNSPNVVRGIDRAIEMGMTTIALTGASGGKLKDRVNHILRVPSTDTPQVQEAHIMLGHIICYLVEMRMFGVSNHMEANNIF